MNTDMRYQEKLDALAADYSREGFDVIRKPRPDALPFDLGMYEPDLIARNGETGYVVAVRSSARRMPIDRLQSVAEEVARHPGWRFVLVTLDDVDDDIVPTTEDDLPGWEQISAKLKMIDGLLKVGALEPALLYLWSLFEAALRRRALVQNIPVERFPAGMMLRHLYTHGEIPVDQLDSFLEFLRKRNRLAHGASESVEPGFMQRIAGDVRALVEEWHGESQANQAAIVLT
jgi:hypothetical protein